MEKIKITLICLDKESLLFEQIYNQYSKTHDVQVWEISQNQGVLEPTHTALIIPDILNFSIGQAIDFFNNMADIIINERKFKRVILLSNGRIYGVSQSPKNLFDENSPYKPYDNKSHNTAIIENALILQYKRFGEKFPLIVLRVCEIISKERIMNIMKTIKNHTTRIVDDIVYNFIYVEDVIQAIWFISNRSFIGKKYNVSTGEQYSFEDICNIVAKNMMRINESSKDKTYNVLDCTLMAEEVKWRASTPIKEIVEAIVKENE